MIINVNIRKAERLTDTFEIDLDEVKANLDTDSLISRAFEIKLQGIYRAAEDKVEGTGKPATEVWLNSHKLSADFSSDVALPEAKASTSVEDRARVSLINAKAKELGMTPEELIAKLTAITKE